jgi:hypothetical protein
MTIVRPYSFNASGSTENIEYQVCDLSVGYIDGEYVSDPEGIVWIAGPDEELGCIIVHVDDTPCINCVNGEIEDKKIRFWRAKGDTDQDFLDIVECATGQIFNDKNSACEWISENCYWSICCEETPIPTPTPTPTPVNYSSLILCTNILTNTNPPQGWESSTEACSGSCTPVTVYVQQPGVTSFNEAVTVYGLSLYISPNFIPENLYVGGSTWYTSQSGEVFQVDDDGQMSQFGDCPTPAPSSTPTATPTPAPTSTPSPSSTPISTSTPTPTMTGEYWTVTSCTSPNTQYDVTIEPLVASQRYIDPQNGNEYIWDNNPVTSLPQNPLFPSLQIVSGQSGCSGSNQ